MTILARIEYRQEKDRVRIVQHTTPFGRTDGVEYLHPPGAAGDPGQILKNYKPYEIECQGKGARKIG